MDRRSFLGGSIGLAAAGLARPNLARAAGSSVIKFVPQRDLNSRDPMWIPAPNVRTHGYMVFDTLYGIDADFRPQPQMAEGASVENNGKIWRITLRSGLKFHDGTPVLARDAAASIRRFCVRDPLGQALASVTDEISAPDDRTVQFRLKRPFALLPDTLSSTPLFMPAIMPERLALTDPLKQVTEMIGSGPFRYVQSEEMLGDRYVYERFADYVPRMSGTPGWTAGPKIVNIDRVEWKVIGDPATMAAALQAGETDWLEYAPLDSIELLKLAKNVKVETTDPTGMKADMRMNQAIAPFDNPEIRRALLGAIQQEEYCMGMAGTDPEGWKTRVGFFVPGSPMANEAGLEVFDNPRDFAAVAAKVKAAGYKGEKVLIMSPGDIPTGKAASMVAADMLRKVGINVEYAEMDWASIATRRMKKDAVDKGGWSIWINPGPGLSQFNPIAATLLRTGPQAYFGWPQGDRLEELRDAWLQAPDVAAQKAIAVEIQKQAFIDLPMIPLGLYYQPTAYRSNLQGVLPGFATFWNVRKV